MRTKDASRRLIASIVYAAVGLVAYIVVVGGLICFKERTYTFSEYITDVKGVYKLLITALVGAVAHALIPRMNGNHKE